MDMVLEVCVNDGESIIIDGFDRIGFSNDANIIETDTSGYQFNKTYPDILNSLVSYKFIHITRHDSADELKYRKTSFAYENSISKKNEPLILTTNSVTTIINMYQ